MYLVQRSEKINMHLLQLEKPIYSESTCAFQMASETRVAKYCDFNGNADQKMSEFPQTTARIVQIIFLPTI